MFTKQLDLELVFQVQKGNTKVSVELFQDFDGKNIPCKVII